MGLVTQIRTSGYWAIISWMRSSDSSVSRTSCGKEEEGRARQSRGAVIVVPTGRRTSVGLRKSLPVSEASRHGAQAVRNALRGGGELRRVSSSVGRDRRAAAQTHPPTPPALMRGMSTWPGYDPASLGISSKGRLQGGAQAVSSKLSSRGHAGATHLFMTRSTCGRSRWVSAAVPGELVGSAAVLSTDAPRYHESRTHR